MKIKSKKIKIINIILLCLLSKSILHLSHTARTLTFQASAYASLDYLKSKSSASLYTHCQFTQDTILRINGLKYFQINYISIGIYMAIWEYAGERDKKNKNRVKSFFIYIWQVQKIGK